MTLKAAATRLIRLGLGLAAFAAYACILFARRYDVITMFVRLRKLRLADPDLWCIAVLIFVSAAYWLGLSLIMGNGRALLNGARRWRPALALAAGVFLVLGGARALYAILDDYGWRVQL